RGQRVDDLCIVRSVFTDIPNHEPSLFMMNCGQTQPGRPSMGSWVTYGLGTENRNLPGFVVFCPGSPVVGPPLWNSAFLPAVYQGTYISNKQSDPDKLIEYIHNKRLSLFEQRRQIDLFDIRKEKESTRARYGDGDFARACLMALRLVERGVRVVQIYFGNGQPWDNHEDIMIHEKLARRADQPIAALLEDLKSRGLLE